MLSPQDEEFISEANRISRLLEKINGIVLSPRDCEHHAQIIERLLRIVAELKTKLEPYLNGEPLDGLIRSMARKNAELMKERDLPGTTR